MTGVDEGFGVSQLHVFAVRSWLGFPQTHKTDGGRQRDYKQKPLHARSQEESAAQKNLEFTLQYLHHVETLSRGEAGPRKAKGRQNELRCRNVSSLSSRGGSKYNSKLQSCSLIKCRGGVYIAHSHRGAPSRQYAPAVLFGSAQTGPPDRTTCITYYGCEDVKFKDPQRSHVGGRCCTIYQALLR